MAGDLVFGKESTCIAEVFYRMMARR